MPVPTRLVLIFASLLLLGACGAPTRAAAPATAAPTTTSLADLVEKVDSIAQDECASKPAATVFPNCPRFVAEVGNVAVAVKGAAPGRTNAEALTTTATSVSDGVATFISQGCVASPSQSAPPAETCGPDLARVQDALRAMRTALATAAAG